MAILFACILMASIWAFWHRKNFVSLTALVALLGGFIFTRGISLISGGWPIDTVQWSELMHEMPLEVSKWVWGYLVLSVVSSLVFFCWQLSYSMDKCDMELVLYFDRVAHDNDTDNEDDYKSANKLDDQ